MKTSVHIPRQKEKPVLKAKKTRRLHRKISLNMEYKKLRSLLPRSTKRIELQRKANVVDAAYQYIRQLQSALLDKFSSRGIPPDLAAVVGNKVTSAKDVQTLALHLIKQNNNNNTIYTDENLNNNINSNNNKNESQSCQSETTTLPTVVQTEDAAPQKELLSEEVVDSEDF